MSRTKILQGDCQHCGGRVEFPAEHAGLTTECPHCQQPTELFLAAPPQASTVPVKTMVFAFLAVLILVGGWIGTQMALKRAQQLTERASAVAVSGTPTPPAISASGLAGEAGFQISAVLFEKTAGKAEIYAVGTLRNETDRQRLGVRVELDLFVASGVRVGSATDTVRVLKPGAEWRFKARVTDPNTTSARLKAITEQP